MYRMLSYGGSTGTRGGKARTILLSTITSTHTRRAGYCTLYRLPAPTRPTRNGTRAQTHHRTLRFPPGTPAAVRARGARKRDGFGVIGHDWPPRPRVQVALHHAANPHHLPSRAFPTAFLPLLPHRTALSRNLDSSHMCRTDSQSSPPARAAAQAPGGQTPRAVTRGV